MKLFGRHDGPIPEDVVAALRDEGLQFLEQPLKGSVRYDDFRAPGKRFNGKVVAVRAGVAVSSQRVVVFTRPRARKFMDLPFGDERWPSVEVAIDGKGRLSLAVDVAAFNTDMSGRATLRMHTPSATAIHDAIRGGRRTV